MCLIRQSSVWFLGLIAFPKLFSPLHNTESISLHKDYCNYLSRLAVNEDGKKLKNDFKGFISNRFGRVGELSKLILEHMAYIKGFFEEYVDENSNKLVLAVNCEIATTFYNDITVTIKQLIGMDEFKDSISENQSWCGIKAEFSKILNSLDDKTKTNREGTSNLIGKAAGSIRDAIRHQLDMIYFFTADEPEDVKNAPRPPPPPPLTNCEGVFSGLCNDCKRAGGSTSLQTISNKNIITSNKLYKKWEMIEDNMRRNFKWARGSPQAKEVRRLEKEFYSNVNAVSDEAMEAKRRTKENKTMKTIKNLEDCKDHGGPLTAKDIDRIDKLTNEQIMLEAKYLKKNVAPNIRFKRKDGKKFVHFTIQEIKQQKSGRHPASLISSWCIKYQRTFSKGVPYHYQNKMFI